MRDKEIDWLMDWLISGIFVKKVISKKGVRLFNITGIQNWQKFNYLPYLYFMAYTVRYFFEWKEPVLLLDVIVEKKRHHLLAMCKKNIWRMTSF